MRKLIDELVEKQQAFAESKIKKQYDEALKTLYDEEKEVEGELYDLVKIAARLYEQKEWEFNEHYGKPERVFLKYSFDFPNNSMTVEWKDRYGCDGYYDQGEFELCLDFVLNENQEQEKYVADIDAQIQKRYEERK